MRKKKEIVLILTENCNLNCLYCFEHHKTHRRMCLDTAKNIIDMEMATDDGTDECQLTMFGGEPLLEFELIKEIYNYVKKRMAEWKKKVIIFINTNGTLATPEVKEWLKDRKEHIYCGISLDGTRKMHNINRSNSFDKIDLEFYKKYWPQQAVKMTLSRETLPYLAEGVIYIHEKGFECGCTFAYGIEWNDELIGLLKKQLDILVEYYTEHPTFKLCQILNIDLAAINNKRKKAFKWCGAGETVKAYDTKGKLYPCHSFSPVALGELAVQFMNYKMPEDDINEAEMCLDCIYYPVCPTCYGVNYMYTGSITGRSRWLCAFYKLCVEASAIIQLRRLAIKKSDELSQHDYGTLLAIQAIKDRSIH